MPTRLAAGRFFGSALEERQTESFSFVERTPELREAEVPLHSHDEAHFVYVVRGLYVTDSHEAPDVCTTGALVFNPRGTTHRDRFRSDEGVFFTIGVAPSIAAMMERRVERARFVRAPQVVSAMGRAYREYRTRDSFSSLSLESLGLDLASRVADDAIAENDAAPPAWLLRARDFLRETLPPPRVSDAARVAGVHPVHLARAFRRHFRCSPGDYLRECRLERARTLLEEKALTLADVADAAGFCDQSELTNALRNTYGWTPREFRALVVR